MTPLLRQLFSDPWLKGFFTGAFVATLVLVALAAAIYYGQLWSGGGDFE